MCKERSPDLEDMLLKAANTNILCTTTPPPPHTVNPRIMAQLGKISLAYNVSTRKIKQREMKKEERKRGKDAEKRGWREYLKQQLLRMFPQKLVSYTQFIQRKISRMLLKAKHPYHSTS